MPAQRKKKRHGEDCLAEVAAITLILESGSEVSFRIADELAIGKSDSDLVADAEKSAARYAFWAYQTELMLLAVKEQEREVADFEGITYIAWRKEGLEINGALPTEGFLRSMLDVDREVCGKREKLAGLRYEYAIVRAVRDSVAKRHEILRTLTMHLRQNRVASQHN